MGVRGAVTDAEEDAPQWERDLRSLFNGLRWMIRGHSVLTTDHPERHAALARGLRTESAVDQGGRVREDGPRPAGHVAPDCRPPSPNSSGYVFCPLAMVGTSCTSNDEVSTKWVNSKTGLERLCRLRVCQSIAASSS